MKQIRLFALILILATVAVYSNSFTIPFLFDDQNAIVDNVTIRSLTPLSKVLWAPAQSSTAGRPLVNLSFAINYAIGELSPVSYHLFNLVVHVLCGLVLFGIIRRTFEHSQPASLQPTKTAPVAAGRAHRKRGEVQAVGSAAVAASPPLHSGIAGAVAAFLTALLWLLHPLQTEAIDYVTQRTESMMTLAYFSTFYCFIRGATASSHSRRWHTLAVIACAAGMMCKESMVTAPVTLLLFDAAFLSDGIGHALRRRRPFYAALASTWLVLLAMNASAPRSHSAGFSTGISPWTYLLNQGPILLRYLLLVVAPIRLVFDYGIPRPVELSTMAPACVVVGLLFLGSIAAWRVDKRLGFLATWVFITLAPASSIVPIATEVGAERRMYLPLAALLVVAVVGLQRLLTRPTWAIGVLSTVAVGFGALTFARNFDYHDPLVLWQTVIDRYPHGRAHYGLGMALKAVGRSDESYREMEIASRDFADAEYAIGFELANQGRHQEAIAALRRYVAAQPDDLNVLRAFNLMGRSYLAMDQPELAGGAFRETLQRHPSNVDALGGLGDAMVRLQRHDEAIAAYQRYLSNTTNNSSAYFNFGLSLMARDRYAEAVQAFRAAATLNPNDAAVHANLAQSLGRLGYIDEAIKEFERVMVLDADPVARRDILQMIEGLRAAR